MTGPDSSPERRRPSEALSARVVTELMDEYAERLFVHGRTQRGRRTAESPHEIQYDFNTKDVQQLLDRTTHNDGLLVVEAYAIYERYGDLTEAKPEDLQESSVVIIMNKLLTASTARNPMYQNTWYSFTTGPRDGIEATYAYEFVQGGRLVTDSIVTSLDERLFKAMRGSYDRQRPLFRDDEVFLKSLLDLIGR